MNRLAALITLLLLASLLPAQLIDPFFMRHSSRCADGNIRLRWEGLDAIECYYSNAGADWQQATSEQISTGTQQALIPFQFGQQLKYRLRMQVEELGQSLTMMHAPRLDSDAFPPSLGQLGLISSDAVGDSVTIYAPMLDLTDTWLGASENKLYATLANVSGSFPTMNSLTSYNIYMMMIFNPETVADSVAYAMVYGGIPLLLPSGLYKLGIGEGMVPEFAQLGTVQSTVSGSKLWLACNIQDLANDPDFGGWPSASGTLLFVGATMRVTVDLGSGTPEFGFGDYAGTALAYFDDHRYLAMANSLPQISNLSLNQHSGLLTFDYLDAEGDFPLTMEFVDAGGNSFSPQPLSLDYSQSVSYSALISPIPKQGELRVSDNDIDLVTIPWEWVSNSDPGTVPAALNCRMPNPLRSSEAPWRLSLDGLGKGLLKLEVFNLRGQNLGSIVSRECNSPRLELTWDGRLNGRRLGSGLYLLRISQGNSLREQRFIIQK